MAVNIEIAVNLVKQAIDQDRRKNYEEAARCYREALNLFDNVSKSRGISRTVKQAIALKCNQYEERLRKLDKFLLASADLTPLFKDVVEYHKRPDSQSSLSDESISSEHWKGLKNCPLFRQGIQAIERGKKKDQRGDFSEALNFYEDGNGLLLEAASNNVNDETEENTQHLRFKCLLIHERIEAIRNHLDSGLPIKPINDSLNTIEYSLGHQNVTNESCTSPEPYEENDENILQSDELGSVHSLYPKCVENLQEKESMDSTRNETPQSIPLADLDGELKLSSLSIASSKSWQSIKSYSSSIKGHYENSGQNSTTFGEADFNITELTIANSGLDLEDYLNKSTPSTDSGIISPKLDQDRSRHDSSSTGTEDEAMLLVHRSGDGTPVIDPSPSRQGSTPPSVRISPSASMKRKATLKAMENELTVLSQEDVVDTAIKVKVSNKPSEYIPPRALAHEVEDSDDENDINKGCFYFVACLDSLWIL